MDINHAKGAVEAVLFAYAEPLSPKKLSEILEIEVSTVKNVCKLIQDDCERLGSGLALLQLGEGYQLATKKAYSEEVKRALDVKRNTPLSQAAFEVLAIIAYNQPVTRSFIEQVRGIDSSSTVVNLVEKGLVAEQGRLDLPGRPMAYKTTDNFLRCFGLRSLEDLPQVERFAELAAEESAEGPEETEEPAES